MEVIGDIVCKVTEDNVKIIDSYKITSKSKMIELLYTIQYKHPECKSFKRSYRSLIGEWRCHNILYRLGIEKDRTKDVDLDAYPNWLYKLIYWIIGI